LIYFSSQQILLKKFIVEVFNNKHQNYYVKKGKKRPEKLHRQGPNGHDIRSLLHEKSEIKNKNQGKGNKIIFPTTTLTFFFKNSMHHDTATLPANDCSLRRHYIFLALAVLFLRIY